MNKKTKNIIIIGSILVVIVVLYFVFFNKKETEEISEETKIRTFRDRLSDIDGTSYTGGSENDTTDTGNIGISQEDEDRIVWIDKRIIELDKLISTSSFFTTANYRMEKVALLSEKETILAKY
jgi:uncharacterized protein YpmB